MIMHEDDAPGLVEDRGQHDLSGVHEGGVQHTQRDEVAFDDPEARVEG